MLTSSFFPAFAVGKTLSVRPVNSGHLKVSTKAYFGLTMPPSIFVGGQREQSLFCGSGTGTCSFVRSCQNAFGAEPLRLASHCDMYSRDPTVILFFTTSSSQD